MRAGGLGAALAAAVWVASLVSCRADCDVNLIGYWSGKVTNEDGASPTLGVIWEYTEGVVQLTLADSDFTEVCSIRYNLGCLPSSTTTTGTTGGGTSGVVEGGSRPWPRRAPSPA